jgi:hypothetical protein
VKSRKKSKSSIPREEIDRRLKLARDSANVRRAARNSIRGKLARALEIVNEAHPYQSSIEIRPIQLTTFSDRWASPWVVVARIRFKGEIGYDQLYDILESWMSPAVMKAVNPKRVSRLRVAYIDRGERKEYTLAETAPWDHAIPRALEETDPTDTESSHPHGAYGSLAARYGIVRNKDGRIIAGSLIPSIDIWLSEQIGFRRQSK